MKPPKSWRRKGASKVYSIVKLMSYYTQPNNYIQSPGASLYTNSDFKISQEPHIQEIISEVKDIQETISGDMDLSYIEFKIKHNKLSFVTTGAWLWQVRTYKSYKKTHRTFEDWCNEVAHITYSTALRLIKGATIWLDLANMGFEILPTSVSQCLVLYKIPPDELYEAWDTVLNNVRPQQITEASIIKILYGETKKIETKVSLPFKLFIALQYIALTLSTTISDVINMMYHILFIDNTEVSDVPDEKYNKWQEDLQLLLLENDLKSVI